MSSSPSPAQPDQEKAIKAQFTEGSIMRHIWVMSTTGAVGLMAMFLVDLMDMYFLSLLGVVELAAAVGYATTILFFTVSVSIGLAIAGASLVSRSVGEGKIDQAKSFATSALLQGLVVSILLSIVVWIYVPELLSLLGALGETHQLAIDYLRIILPSMFLMNIGMISGAIMRSVGDAKRSMYHTVGGAVVNGVFDPILIFGFDMGIEGAAWATVLARVAIGGIGLYFVMKVHDMVKPIPFKQFMADIRQLVKIAGPAILTNVSTPIGNAYVTAVMAGFGDQAVAGNAIVGRVTPVAFALFFSLSGAIGPIVGQNYGAKRFDRLRSVLTESLKFTILYSIGLWVFFIATHSLISDIFAAEQITRDMIAAFAWWVVPLTFFLGMLFVANAMFNALGYAYLATISNFSKATLGTMPFVSVGAAIAGATGILIGQAIGTMVFAVAAVLVGYGLVSHLEKKHSEGQDAKMPASGWKAFLRFSGVAWPFSSGRTQNPMMTSDEESRDHDGRS